MGFANKDLLTGTVQSMFHGGMHAAMGAQVFGFSSRYHARDKLQVDGSSR